MDVLAEEEPVADVVGDVRVVLREGRVGVVDVHGVLVEPGEFLTGDDVRGFGGVAGASDAAGGVAGVDAGAHLGGGDYGVEGCGGGGGGGGGGEPLCGYGRPEEFPVLEGGTDGVGAGGESRRASGSA